MKQGNVAKGGVYVDKVKKPRSGTSLRANSNPKEKTPVL